MRTFRNILNCEGYYYNVQAAEILRNVGPGQTRCWSAGSWVELDPGFDLDTPQFEMLTSDISIPFEVIRREVAKKFGASAAPRMMNRQTAVQPDGTIITEEAKMSLSAATPHSTIREAVMECQLSTELDPVCGMEIKRQDAAATSEYQGQTFYFCNPSCKRQFDQNPERYAKAK